ncbi:acyltransferase [Spirochaetia bacterium]|nr:acyltransferase [Spirochaetia bacterium]
MLSTPLRPTVQCVTFFDGLRGWASFSVLLVHIGVALYGWPDFQHEFLKNNFGKIFWVFFDGTFAVYIFFVLSGVVLSLSFMKNFDTHSLTKIAICRIPRLGIPVVISTIIVFLLLKYGFMYNHEAAILNNRLNVSFNSYYNFTPTIRDMIKSIPNVFLKGDNSYNNPLWTMRAEFLGSYYLVIFLLIIKFSSIHKIMVVWILSTIFLLYKAPPLAAFNFGIFVSFVYVNKSDCLLKLRRNKYIQIGMLIIIGVFYGLKLVSGELGYEKIHSFLIGLTAFLIVIGLTFINIFQTFFSYKISRFLGKISFPLYIVHTPITCSFTAYLMIKYPEFQSNPMISIIIYVLSGMLALIIACCFYPFEKLSIWFSKKIYEFIVEKDLFEEKN